MKSFVCTQFYFNNDNELYSDKQQIIGSNNFACKLNYFVMKVIEENIFDYTFFASFQFRTKYLLIAVKEYKKSTSICWRQILPLLSRVYYIR